MQLITKLSKSCYRRVQKTIVINRTVYAGIIKKKSLSIFYKTKCSKSADSTTSKTMLDNFFNQTELECTENVIMYWENLKPVFTYLYKCTCSAIAVIETQLWSGLFGNGMTDWRDGIVTALEQQSYMLEHGIHCDCTFTVGPEKGETKVFHAHKFVLIRASSVFEAMLLGHMSERSGQVRITDLLPDTFHLLLRHTYTDTLQISSCEEAHDLALAADKYLLSPLKEKCADFLASNVAPDSVWRTLALAHLLQHKKLREACIKIMQWETSSCIASDDFMTIPEDNLLLLLEQDCLNITSELELIEGVIHWARQRAERQGLSNLDSSVREIIQPRLLSKLRFLALKPEDFANGPAVSNWLTDTEKSSILVNLISPGKMTVLESLCANAKPRISLVKLASDNTKSNPIVKSVPSGVFVCTRLNVSHGNNVFNSGNLRASLSVKTDRDAWIIGMKLSSQLKNENLMKSNPKNFFISNETRNCYSENIYYKISEFKRDTQNVYSSDHCFCKGEFSANVDYNSQITINFPKKLYFEKGKAYFIDINFRKLGYYPTSNRSNYVRFGNVDFEFAFSLGSTPTIQNSGAIEALIFTAEDLYSHYRH